MRNKCVNCGRPTAPKSATCGRQMCLLALAWLCGESCNDDRGCEDCFVFNSNATIDEQLTDFVASPPSPEQRGM